MLFLLKLVKARAVIDEGEEFGGEPRLHIGHLTYDEDMDYKRLIGSMPVVFCGLLRRIEETELEIESLAMMLTMREADFFEFHKRKQPPEELKLSLPLQLFYRDGDITTLFVRNPRFNILQQSNCRDLTSI